MGNFDDFTAMPNDYFHHFQDSSYESESELYDVLNNEMINIHGTPLMYYVVSYDVRYDPLFGEDNSRRVARKFPIKAHFELPKEIEMFSKFGIEGLDNFPIYVSKRHFSAASKYDTSGVTLYPAISGSLTSVFDEYQPKAGDILRTEYNDLYYEIVDVKDVEEMFLQRNHTWTFQIRKLTDESLGLSATTSASLDEIGNVVSASDNTSLNKHLTSADDSVLYDPSGSEESSDQDDLGGWFD